MISVLMNLKGWTCIGHGVRMDINNNCRITLMQTPEERRNRGRPKEISKIGSTDTYYLCAK